MLEHQNEEIKQQAEELKALTEALRDQKEVIETKNKEILASIRYAYRIQKTLIQASDVFRKFLPPHYLVFLPRDILSGDFYWIYKTHKATYVAVADCTGHGVPGALISILGMEFLNQIIKTNQDINPDEMLNILREKIIERLFPDKREGHKDGMDISLVKIIDKKIMWAGANNPLYIVTQNQNSKNSLQNNVKLLEEEENIAVFQLDPDKQPIAHYEKLEPFTLHTVELNSEDEIILLSDGLQDQFGGKRNKKFGKRNLRRMFIKLYHTPIQQRENKIIQVIREWQGANEQLDDITIMGIKF